MTNSIGYGSEVPAPQIRRRICKTKPNMSKAEKQQFYSHGRAELDAAGFIRAEKNDKRTHIKKFVENFTFL